MVPPPPSSLRSIAPSDEEAPTLNRTREDFKQSFNSLYIVLITKSHGKMTEKWEEYTKTHIARNTILYFTIGRIREHTLEIILPKRYIEGGSSTGNWALPGHALTTARKARK